MTNLQHLLARRNRPAWAVLLACLSLTIAAWYGLRTQSIKNAQQQFGLHVNDVIDAIEKRLYQHEQILLGSAGLFDASTGVDRAEWRAYIERLNLNQNYPGIQGVGFSQLVRHAELRAHIAAIRGTGFPDYTINPPGERALYSPIIYLEPSSGRNLAAFGYDMMAETVRAKAMRMAAESGKTAISGKVRLVQETHGREQAGFLMYLPVYHRHEPTGTPEERWKALLGFVYSPYRVDDMMAGILGDRMLMLDFVIFDGREEADAARMFTSAGEQTTRVTPPRMTVLRTIRAYGHTWTVRLNSRPEFDANFESALDTIILVLGMSISLLLFAMVSFLISRREMAEVMAKKMTRDIRANEEKLRQSEARLAEGQRIAKLGSWNLNLLTGELIWSQEIFRLFEVDREQFSASYEGFLNAVHPEDREAVDRAYTESLRKRQPYEITHRLLMADGRIKWVQERCSSDFDQEGRPVCSRGTVQDITELKIAEDELQQTKYLLESIVENIPTMVFLKRAGDLCFELFNHAGEKLLGYTRNDLLGKNDYDLFSREQADRFTDADRKVLASDGVIEIPEEPVTTAGGESRYFHTWKIALRDASGKPNHLLGISIDITERKNTAEAIARISNLNRAIVDGADHLIITTDTSGVIQSFNRAAEMRLGYQAEELIGKSTPAVFHDADEVARCAQELKAAGMPVVTGFDVFVATARRIYGGDTREWTYIRKDGSRFPVLLTVTALRDGLGDINAFLGIATDITERNQAAQFKRDEAVRMGAILDNVVDGIITIDEAGRIESFNRAAVKIFGYEEAEAIGKNVSMLMPEPYHSQHDGYLRNYVSTGTRKVIGIGRQVMGERKDGAVFPMDLAVSEMQLGGRRIFTGIVRDITERKHAEEELRKLSRAVEQSPVSVMITDAMGNIEYVNAKFSAVTGYTLQEVMGVNPRIIQSGMTPVELYRSMWQAIQGGQQWRGKLQNRKKNGDLFWEEIYISAIRDSDGNTTHYVAVKEDITERIKHERMKSEFISTVSHELRTPLTSIRGALGLIAGGVGGVLPAQVNTLVDIAHKNSERLILLVNDILDMEKIEAGKMEFQCRPTELMPLLRQALEGNRAYAEQFNINYELEGDLPEVVVNVDANRLMQVLANLLSNAAKFSPNGDTVTVSVAVKDKRVRIMVSDHGSGISEQFRSHIFQKFAQADSSDTRKKGGTGLGLSITKAIVEKMGGSIGFDSQPGVLTTFFVEFSIWKEEASAAPESCEAEQRKRVLICEDDGDIAALLRLMLEQAGLAADVAYSTTQAKQMLAQHIYAAMTLDMDMSEQNGIALISELRSSVATATLPIVVVSSCANEQTDGRRGGDLNVIDWISKPINREQFVSALQQAVWQNSEKRPRVLHVEDDPDIFRVVGVIVGDLAELDNATSLTEARRMLEHHDYDLVILDLSLPDGSGMELLPLLNGAMPPIPVMVFSASEMAMDGIGEIKSVLVKSRTDNAQLLATIKRLIGAG